MRFMKDAQGQLKIIVCYKKYNLDFFGKILTIIKLVLWTFLFPQITNCSEILPKTEKPVG